MYSVVCIQCEFARQHIYYMDLWLLEGNGDVLHRYLGMNFLD